MSQQYQQYSPNGGGYDYPQAPAADPYTSQLQGYYAAPQTSDYGNNNSNNNSASLLPGYPSAAPPHPTMYGQQQQQHSPYGGHHHQQQQQQQQAPYDPYGGYDAVNYPSIPALIEDSQRASSRSASNYRRSSEYGGSSAPSVSRASKPQEESGATYGNSRYRCMLLPTRDGGDIEPLVPYDEDVVCQVGLDGVQMFNGGGSSPMSEHKYPMDVVSRWQLTDATILTVHVKPNGGEEFSIALSSDKATTGAIMDTLTTSAFQW